MLVKAAFYKEGKVAVVRVVEVFKLCIIVDQRSRLNYNEHVSISFFPRVYRMIEKSSVEDLRECQHLAVIAISSGFHPLFYMKTHFQ